LDIRRIRRLSKMNVGDKPMTIGRSSSNLVVLSDTHVSRHHCVIEVLGGAPVLRDLGSRLGTKLNGEKVLKARLQNGDRIRVGPFEIVFDDPDAPARRDDEAPEMASATANGLSAGGSGEIHLEGDDSAAGHSHHDSAVDDRSPEEALSGEFVLVDEDEPDRKPKRAAATTAAPRAQEEDLLRERLARQELEQQLQTVQAQVKAMESHRDTMLEALQQWEAAQEQWLSERTRLIEAASRPAVDGPQGHQQAEAIREQTLAEQQEHVAGLQEQVETARAEALAGQRERMAELQQQVEASTQELASLREQYETLAGERAANEARLAELTEDLARWHHEADVARQHAHSLESERDRVTSLEATIDESKAEQRRLQQVCDDLATERAQATDRLGELEGTISALRQEIDAGKQVEQDLVTERERAATLEQKAQEAWREQSAMQARCEQLQKERQGADARAKDLESTAAKWRSQAETIRRELESKTRKLDELAGLAAALQTQIEQLEISTADAVARASEDLEPDDDRPQVQEILYEDSDFSGLPQPNAEEAQSVAAMLAVDPSLLETRTVDAAEEQRLLRRPTRRSEATEAIRSYAGPIDFLRQSVERIRALAEEKDRLAMLDRRAKRKRAAMARIVAACVAGGIVIVAGVWWTLSR